MSRIEQVISDIEAYLDDCKFQPFSNTKIIVDKDQLEDMLAELRLKTPEEIKKYQKIINNKEAILNDAKEQADAILDAAKVQTEELINEHEIMQRAYEQADQTIQAAQNQAQEIVDRAAAEANEMRSAAVAYTDQMLASLQQIIEHSVETNKEQYGSLMSKLNDTLHVVVNNRNELRGQSEPESDAQDVQQ